MLRTGFREEGAGLNAEGLIEKRRLRELDERVALVVYWGDRLR